ncbi:uncharacterized protein LOC126707024 [Quercus robur]|uniref:uncharacterized protein LOC126707024 n=1 Tax=Quercus robur TaxID=38942 RepID=UPI0021633674|nr:uncharacterized protein LOC126707024 [Quercus robur]
MQELQPKFTTVKGKWQIIVAESSEKKEWNLKREVELMPSYDECYTPTHPIIMNILVWNSRGVLKPNFQEYVRELVRVHNPAILVIMETRLGGERAKGITDRLPFDGAIHTETIGYVGGLWLLWNFDLVEVVQLANTEQEVHVEVKVIASNLYWILCAVYASPTSAERYILWENLIKVAGLHNKPWVIAGDFNEPLLGEDKFGGRPVSISRSLLFKDYSDKCNMVDLGFSGPRYMWTNRKDLNNLIQERIDQFFTNPSWCLLYPEARVTHLTRCHSDHCPVLMEAVPKRVTHLNRPFKFQSFWLSNPSFPGVVMRAWSHTRNLSASIEKFTNEATQWNKNQFGNIFEKKRRLMARLNGIQRTIASNPTSHLIDLENQL